MCNVFRHFIVSRMCCAWLFHSLSDRAVAADGWLNALIFPKQSKDILIHSHANFLDKNHWWYFFKKLKFFSALSIFENIILVDSKIIGLGDCYRRIVTMHWICIVRTSSLYVYILNAIQRTWTSRKRPQIRDNVMPSTELPQLLVRCHEKFQKIWRERWRRGHCRGRGRVGGGSTKTLTDDLQIVHMAS